VAEILSGGRPGPDRRTGGPGPVRPRRWLVATGVLVAAAAVALAARSGSGADPAPPLPPALAATPPKPSVVSVAVGTRWAYALVATCGVQIVHECDYRLHRRQIGGAGWQPTSMRITGRTTTSLGITLYVGGEDRVGEDRVILVQRDESVSLSTDGGATVRTVLLRPGSPVAALPAGGILANGLCGICDDAVSVLDPANGAVRPLTAQPALGGSGLRLTYADGPVLWVALVGPAGVSTAVSRDGGRRWRTVPLAGGLVGTGPVVLAGAPGGGAYLVGRRQDSRLPDVRRVDSPDGSWQRLTPPAGPNAAYSAVVGARGLLVGDENGQAWRLLPSGRFRRLADAPGYLAGGPGGVLLGLPTIPRTVLISYDDGESWLAEQVVR
jgi:hypothetical protein